MRDRRLQIALYLLAAFFSWACFYLYAPTLPTYVESKTGSLAVVGVILAQFGLWQAIIHISSLEKTYDLIAGENMLGVVGRIALIGISLGDLSATLPQYQVSLPAQVKALHAALDSVGLGDSQPRALLGQIDPGNIRSSLGSFLAGFLAPFLVWSSCSWCSSSFSWPLPG